jgi:membrane fusion protein (multidrug efflux system)
MAATCRAFTYRNLLAGLLLLSLAACGKKGEEDKKAGGPQAGPTPVKLVEAQEQQAIYYDEYPARVAALNIVELRTQVPGFVTGIYFKEGELVKKGQPLYEIDRRKYQAAVREARAGLQSAQAQLANAQLNLSRYQRLAQQDAIARQIVDNSVTTEASARAQVEVARAALATAQTDLDYSLVRAPFTGRIGISQVRLGAQISAGSTLLNTISSEDPMGVDFVVNEQELSRFQALQGEQQGGLAAQDSSLRLALPGGKIYQGRGRVRAVDRGVDNQTGSVQVRMQFDNPGRELKDGLTVVLRVLNEQSGRRVVVPNKAILDQMGESFVFVVRDTVALQRRVELGPRLRDDIVVLKGLKAGEKIVTEGLQQLRDSASVTTGRPKPPKDGKKNASTNGKGREDSFSSKSVSAAQTTEPHPRRA